MPGHFTKRPWPVTRIVGWPTIISAASLLNEPGRLEEAIDHFRAALRLQPNYPQTYDNLGIALSNIPGRLPEAITYFEAAVRIQPDYAQAQNNLDWRSRMSLGVCRRRLRILKLRCGSSLTMPRRTITWGVLCLRVQAD